MSKANKRKTKHMKETANHILSLQKISEISVLTLENGDHHCAQLFSRYLCPHIPSLRKKFPTYDYHVCASHMEFSLKLS